jgi:CSLREA domain-containing protein
LKRLFAKLFGKTKGGGQPRRAGTRPALEALEDRLAPAIFNVNTFADVVNPNDGKLSLREAISMANATAEPDVIQLQAGVYAMRLAGAGEDANASGDFDITNPLTIQGAGPAATAIDAGNLDRVFEIHSPGPVKFSGLTLRNGFAPPGFAGGGIFADVASLTLDHCHVNGNAAEAGGGIYSAEGLVRLKDSTVSGNVAIASDGGGIDGGDGTVRLLGSTVSDNTAAGSGGGIYTTVSILTSSTVSGNHALANGGGIRTATATLTSSIISGNHAGQLGGGLFATKIATLTSSTVRDGTAGLDGGGVWSDVVHLISSTVNGNTASHDGGGVWTRLFTVDFSTIRFNRAGNEGGGIHLVNGTSTMDSSTVSNNLASQGGGLFSDARVFLNRSALYGNRAVTNGGGLLVYNTATLQNVTLSGNTALSNGGGSFVFGTLNLINVTVTRNAAAYGGGVAVAGQGVANVKNTILAGNHAAGTPWQDLGGVFTSLGHNLIGIGYDASGFTDKVQGDQVGTVAAPLDPHLGPLANNGGPTLTHALLAHSPAIDRGDNTDIAFITDQRGTGFSRIKDGDGNGRRIIDIGAWER